MQLKEFDLWCKSFLEIDRFSNIDPALNGIQVARRDGEITKIACAVDACKESFIRARDLKADLIFVHHGLFWGDRYRIEGNLLERLRILLEANIALYACHLPLDQNAEIGNNAILAKLLDLENIESFGDYHGAKIGYAGKLKTELDIENIIKIILPDGSPARTVFYGKKAKIKTIAIISGGAPKEISQAIDQDFDLYITGEPSHEIYHQALEAGISFIAAGHYETEVWGVKAFGEKIKKEKGMSYQFIDLPSSL